MGQCMGKKQKGNQLLEEEQQKKRILKPSASTSQTRQKTEDTIRVEDEEGPEANHLASKVTTTTKSTNSPKLSKTSTKGSPYLGISNTSASTATANNNNNNNMSAIDEDDDQGEWSDDGEIEPEQPEEEEVPSLEKEGYVLPSKVKKHPLTESQEVKVLPAFSAAAALPRHMMREKRTETKVGRDGKTRNVHRFNSTSSLYITDTMATPNIDELLRSLAAAIRIHIEKGHRSTNQVFFEIFSEKKHPITPGKLNLNDPPSEDTIFMFLRTIFKRERLPAECAILCLAYIERIMTIAGITLHASNWRRVCLGALIIASKVWEDQAVWNVDFLDVFPNLDVHDLNKLERRFLDLLQYNVSLKASVYAKYFFELRALSTKEESFPLKPLDKHAAEKLEKRAAAAEERARQRPFKKTQSLNAIGGEESTKSPPVIIS